jgi:hypothetical protein
VHDAIGFIESVERVRGPGLALAPAAMTGMNNQWRSIKRYRTCRHVHPPSMLGSIAFPVNRLAAYPTFGVLAPAPRNIGCDPSGLITLARRGLPDRKRSADIIGHCPEYTEGEAAANKAEQHGRFHTIDLFPVKVRLLGEVGHGNSPCNTLPNPFVIKLSCDLH